jgi:hypothetical protein
MNPHWFHARFGVILAACAISGSVLPGCSETGDEHGALAGGRADGGSEGEVSSVLDPATMGRVEIVSALEGRAIESLAAAFGGDLDPGARIELALAFGRTVDLYVFGSSEDFLASLRSEEAVSEQDASQFRAQWERAAEIIGAASMDGSGVEAHLAVAGGERLESKPRLGATVVEGTRRGAGGLGDPRAEGLDVVEISVPMRIRPINGEATRGRFGLSFAFDPDRRAWVLVKTAIGCDDTEGVLVAPPL